MKTKLIWQIVMAAMYAYSCNAGAQTVTPDYISDMQNTIVFAAQYGKLGIDESSYMPGQKGSPLRIKDKLYKKGLGTHANSKIVIDLGGAYSAFESEVGIQWHGSDAGSVIFKVLADDNEIFNSGTMTGTTPAKSVNVSVAGVQYLTLIMVDSGEQPSVAFNVGNWAEARITRAEGIDTRAKTKLEAIDIAPFGRVLTWDTSRMKGCQNGRFEEFTV
ncbi:MAG: NPCBM/NEW2 domain-containing protein, partial [Phycisphaerae bacterium]